MPMKNSSTFILFIKKLFFNSYCKCDVDPFFEMDADDYRELGRDEYSPSEETVQKIIEFAHTYGVLKTKSAGLVELNLN
jgi:hypothetical protein